MKSSLATIAVGAIGFVAGLGTAYIAKGYGTGATGADPRLEAQMARLSFYIPSKQMWMTVKKLVIPTYYQWQYIGATWGLTVTPTEPDVQVAENDVFVDVGIDTNTGKASFCATKLGWDSVEIRVDGTLVHTFPQWTGVGSQSDSAFNMELP